MSKETETTNVARAFRLRWTVGRKLGALVAVLLGLLMIGSVHSLVRMSEVGEEVHEIAGVDLPLLNLVSTVEIRQLERHIVLERALRAAGTDQAAFTRELARFDEVSRQIGDAITAALALAGNNDARGALARQEYASVKERLETLRTEHGEFEAHAQELFRRLESGQDANGAADAIAKVEREAAALDSSIRPLEEELWGFTQRGAALAEDHEQSAFSLTLLLAAVALILGVSVSIWLVRRMTRTVQAVTEGAERLARGELNADPVDVSTTDELGKLATVFNGMVTNLAGQVRDTRTALETLTAAANEILAATKEQAATTKEQAATTKEQAATIQEITASMEEIGQSGSQISERAGDVAQRAESSSMASSSGRDAMRETNRDMESIRDQIEEVAENIVALSEKTQAVGEIIAAVNEIAEQSNLLALNAAIEAAAAGEQGSRFSVVANEIKNLADQAKDSTGQVRKILGEIQKGINAAVMLTEEAVKRAEQGKQKASTTEMTIEELLSSTQDSIEAFQQIVAGSNQQQIGITQVTQGMQDIRQAAEQNAVGTSQLERAVSDLTSLGSQLEGVVAQYSL